MFNLDGHVALITGGNGGIGLAFARGLVKSGASIAIWARNEEKNAVSVAELTSLGGQAKAFVGDVTDESQVNDAFAATLAHYGKVDSCFANAGGGGPAGFLHETDSSTWNSGIDLNVNSVVNTFRPVIAHLLERKTTRQVSGNVLNCGSNGNWLSRFLFHNQGCCGRPSARIGC